MDELLARCREAEAQSSIGPWSQAREEMIRNAKDKKCRFQSAVFFNLFMFVVRIGVLIIFQIFWASTACVTETERPFIACEGKRCLCFFNS